MKTWKIILLAILIVILVVVGRLVYWIFFEPLELISEYRFEQVTPTCASKLPEENFGRMSEAYEKCQMYGTEQVCNESEDECVWTDYLPAMP